MTALLEPRELALPTRSPSFQSADADEIRLELTRLVAPHRLQPLQRRPLAARHTTLRMGGLTIFQVGYGAEVRIEAEGCGPYYIAKMPVAGQARIRSHGDEVHTGPATAAVLNPDLPLRFDYGDDCSHLVVCIGAAELERHCARLLGNEGAPRPIRFRLGMDLHSAAGQHWMRLATHLVREATLSAADGPFIGSQLTAAPLEQLVMTALLVAQPHNHSAALLQPVAAAAPRALASAEAYMEAHADQPLTPADLARAAGVSERALFRAFKQHRGQSPMDRLRTLRLERVHRELRAGTPGLVSVTEVALRWGFSHLGHFGQAYRRRFGETPLQSLHRSSR